MQKTVQKTVRKTVAWIGALTLTASLCFSSYDISVAVNYDAKIKENRSAQKAYEKKTEQLQDELEEIQQIQEDTLAYIEKLDKKTEQVEKQLAELKVQISDTQESLQMAEENLAQAQVEKLVQYTAMKERIKYMYENGNQGYLELLFSSENISELVNRTEYIKKISDYDKKLFARYQKTCDDINFEKQEIETSLSNLEKMQSDVDAEEKALESMKSRKEKELKKYARSAKKKESKALEYAKKAAEAEAEVERLLEEKQREIDLKSDVGGGNSGSSALRWPLKVAGRISSGFGPRSSPTPGASSYHKGIDVAVPLGTPIVAAGAGTVVTATYSSSAGNYIMISHGNRLYTVYMHCSKLAVSVGDEVVSGQIIAYAGSTGISTGSHLHFGVMKNGSYVDPGIYVTQP